EQLRTIPAARIAQVPDQDAVHGEARFELRPKDAIPQVTAKDACDVLLWRHVSGLLVIAPKAAPCDNPSKAEGHAQLAKGGVERLTDPLSPRSRIDVDIRQIERVSSGVVACERPVFRDA